MTLRDGTTCRMMSRVNDDESSSGAFVWCLPLLWLAGSVLIQLAMAPFASSSASGSAAILTFTLLMLMSLIVTLGSDNLDGGGKVMYVFYSIVGWALGVVVMLGLDTRLYHHSLT